MAAFALPAAIAVGQHLLGGEQLGIGQRQLVAGELAPVELGRVERAVDRAGRGQGAAVALELRPQGGQRAAGGAEAVAHRVSHASMMPCRHRPGPDAGPAGRTSARRP